MANIQQQHKFKVLKEVICQVHNKKVIKLNLNPNPECKDDDRLYCEECQIKDETFVYSYEEIFMKIKSYSYIPGQVYGDDLNVVYNILVDQIAMIKLKLEQYSHLYLEYPTTQDLREKLLSPDLNYYYGDLLNLSKILSQKIVPNKQKIQFKKPTPSPKEQLQKIKQSVLALKNCAIQVAEIMNLPNPQPRFLNYSNPIICQNQPEVIQTVKYDLLIEKQIPFKVSSTEIIFHLYQVIVAEDREIDKHYSIYAFNMNWQKKKFDFYQKLTKHRKKIVMLQKHSLYNLFSIDIGQQIFAWNFDPFQKIWVFQRQFDASIYMTSLNCIAGDYLTNMLFLGGDTLLVWKLEFNKETQILKNFHQQDQVQCLAFNEKSKLLLSGSKLGYISLFSYTNSIWQKVLHEVIFYNQIKSLRFLSKSDFMYIQDKQLVIWKYNREIEEYESKSQTMEDLDTALMLGRAVVKPMINNDFIYMDYFSYDAMGDDLLVVKNDQLQFFFARQIM